MEDVKEGFRRLRLSDLSLAKLVGAFGVERSESSLIIPTSDKNEQALILNLLSLLDRTVKMEDAHQYLTPRAVVVQDGAVLIKKLRDSGVDVDQSTSRLMRYLDDLEKNQKKSVTLHKGHPFSNRPYLEITNFKSEAAKSECLALLAHLGIYIGVPDYTYGEKPLHFEREHGEPVFVLRDDAAIKIAQRLATWGVDFDGRDILPSGNSQNVSAR